MRRKIYKTIFLLMIAVLLGRGLTGCETEYEFVNPDFEINVEFFDYESIFEWNEAEEKSIGHLDSTFFPYYYKIASAADWIHPYRTNFDEWVSGEYTWGSSIYIFAEQNNSPEPRNAIVKVIVSNVPYDEKSRGKAESKIEFDIPVYSFEFEVSVTQKGRPAQ